MHHGLGNFRHLHRRLGGIQTSHQQGFFWSARDNIKQRTTRAPTGCNRWFADTAIDILGLAEMQEGVLRMIESDPRFCCEAQRVMRPATNPIVLPFQP